jgi:SAM-dependent methyltransferase
MRHQAASGERRDVRLVLDGGADDWDRINAAYEAGGLDDAGWHAAVGALLTPAYLAGDNPRAQSGFSGDDARWEAARRIILRAVDGPGSFLDVGCASGYLMESLRKWAGEDGIDLEPHGLDISPELAELARRRLPEWADRIHVGNVMTWLPPGGRRYDYVRTGLEYVPPGRRGDLVTHLLTHVVGRRLIVGSNNEEKHRPYWREQVEAAGYTVAGWVEVPHPDPRVVRSVFWVDA